MQSKEDLSVEKTQLKQERLIIADKKLETIDRIIINSKREEFSERSKSELNHPLLKALKITESSVILDQDGEPYKYNREKSWTDIAVFHPNTEYINDRPNWLFTNGNKNISVTLNDINISFPVMIYAFNKGEDIYSSVPIDIVEVKSKTDNCSLGLMKGDYEIVIANKLEDARKFDLKVK